MKCLTGDYPRTCVFNGFQINQYISLYTRTGVPPSKVFQGKAAEVCFLLWQSSITGILI